MTSKQNVDLVQKALAALLESEGENKWITINGTHVQVDGKGSIVSGPANLKSWDAKPKWEPKESPTEKGTAKDWNAKGAWGGPSAPPPIAQENDQKAEAKAESPIAQAKDQIKAPAQDAGKIGGKGRELEAPRITYMNPHDIAAQKDVKQFKEGANALTGEVEPLEGHYDHRGSGPIQVWQRNDGTHEVISGRHRLAHAKRNGVTELPVQVYKESEGFTQAHALGMDAELNIRDGNGSVADYARHFANNPHITEEDAKKKGLLGRAKGQSGWTIGRHGTEQLRAAHQGKKIKDSHAETIARIAPGDADIQRAGMTMAAEGKTGEHIENTLMSMKAQAFASGMSQADMFGNNDSAIKEMEETATRAGQIRRAINNQIHAVKGAANRPEEAKALGVDVSNPEEIKAKVKDLEAQAERWKNWAVHPDLAAQAFGRDMTPQAQAIAQAQAEAPQAPPPVESGVDMFGNPTGKAKPEMMTDLFGNQVTVDAEKQPEAPKAEDPSAWMDKPADLKKDGTGEMFGGLFSPDRQIPSEPSEPPRISQGIDEVPSSGVSKADIRNGASGDQFHEIGSDNKKAGMDNVNERPKANPDYRPPAGFVAPSNQDELHQRMTQAMDDHELHAGSVDKYLAAQTGKLKKNADGYHVAIDPVTGQESILSKDESTAKAMQSALFATRSRAAGDKRDSAKADNHNLHQFVNAHDGKPFGDGDQAEEKGGYPNPTQGALHGDYPDNPEADKQPGATAAQGGEKPKRFWEPKGEIPEFHAHTGYKFKKMKGLTPEEEKEEAALHQYAQDNYEDLRDKYLQKGKKTGKDGKTKYDLAHYDDEGNLASVNLNIDEWRDFLPGYKGTNPHVNQTTGHYLSSRLTHEMLHEMKGKGNNSIAVLAGGGGSGKTSAVKNYYNLKDYPIVLDQVTGDLDKANQAFDMAEKNGYGSKYIFVDRAPNDAWKEGVIKRAQSLHGKWTEWDQGGRQGPEPAKGRTVPVDVAVHDNFGARQTAHDLVKAGRQIDVVDNNHGFGKAKKLEDPQEQLKHFENPVNNHNFDDTIKRAVDDTRELHQSGGLSDDHHGALLGRHASGNGHVQPAQLPTNAGSGLPNDPRGPEAASGTGGQGTPLGGSPSPTEAAEAGPSTPPTVSGASPATPGRKRAALTKADQGTIQAEVDRLGHEMSQLKKSDPQYRILYKRRQHTLAKLSPTGSGGAGANSSATTPTPSGPAPAGPSAPPAITPEREDELVKQWQKRVAQVNKAADTPTVNKKAEKLKAEAEAEAKQIATRAGELEKETRAKGYGDLADKAKAVGERAQAQGQGQAPGQGKELDGYLKRVEDNRRRNNAAITDPSKINAQRFAMRLADVHKGLENGHPDAPKAAANWLSQAQTWAADKSDWGKDNPEDHKAVTDQIAKVKAKLGQGETIGGKPVQGNTAGDEYLQRTKASFDNEVAQSAKDRGRNTPNHTMVSNGILARHMDDLTNGVNRFHLLDHVRDNHPDLYDHLRNPDNRKYWSNHKNQLEMHLEDNPVKSAQAGPSAPPAMPAQAKPQRKAPEAIDGSQYFGPDGKLDTKTLGDHITKAGGTWDTDSAIARAYRPMRAALKAAPDVKTTYDVLDHIMGTQPALYNHAKQDAKYGNLPHHIQIGNHYQLRYGVPLKRTNGQTVGSLPSKAYDRPVTPGEIRTEPGSKNQTQFQKSLGVLSERINGHGSFYKKNWELMQMLSRGWPKDEVLDHVRDNHPDLYEGLRNDVTPGPGRGYPLTYDTQIETVRNHLAKNAQKGTQESFRPKPQQTITRLVDWLTQE